MLLNEQKDGAMKELNDALLLVREELVRHKELLEATEQDNAALRTRIRELEAQLLRKSEMMQQWLEAHEPPDEMTTPRRSPAVEQRQHGVAGDGGGREPLDRGPVGQDLVARGLARRAVDPRARDRGQLGLLQRVRQGAVQRQQRWHGARVEATSCRAMGEYRGTGTAHPLLCVRVSEDGEMVLGTGCDRKCFVWRVGTGRVFQTLTGHKGKVLAAEFSTLAPNEVITGSSDRSLRVWDVAKGRSVQSVNCRSSCNDLAMALGGQFASAHQDGAVRFWDARSKQPLRELSGLHADQVTSVSFSRDGNRLLTNSQDNTAAAARTRARSRAS
ncbi:hypothetical protein PINS_up012931 [Pythium insidiosum]|nr:hypothetical protein PINS_up012931 [Pythium insidiosum]